MVTQSTSDGLPLDFLIQKIQILVVIHLSYIGSPLKARPIRRLAKLWKKLHFSFTAKSAKIRARPELFRTETLFTWASKWRFLKDFKSPSLAKAPQGGFFRCSLRFLKLNHAIFIDFEGCNAKKCFQNVSETFCRKWGRPLRGSRSQPRGAAGGNFLKHLTVDRWTKAINRRPASTTSAGLLFIAFVQRSFSFYWIYTIFCKTQGIICFIS